MEHEINYTSFNLLSTNTFFLFTYGLAAKRSLHHKKRESKFLIKSEELKDISTSMTWTAVKDIASLAKNVFRIVSW